MAPTEGGVARPEQQWSCRRSTPFNKVQANYTNTTQTCCHKMSIQLYYLMACGLSLCSLPARRYASAGNEQLELYNNKKLSGQTVLIVICTSTCDVSFAYLL